MTTRPAKDANPPPIHEPKNDIESRHKVINFGRIFKSEEDDQEEDCMYQYLHQRADLKVSKGAIPIDFLSVITLDEGHPIYLQTKYGDRDEREQPVGPMYQVTWKADRSVLGGGQGDGWSANLDELWSNVLATFERKNLLGEVTLDYLDADPFVLFGIDDPVTQQALKKLEMFPALLCEGSTPSFEEWARYIRVEGDSQFKWLVRAFCETDLPKPWTCYKGVGSIVCYIRADTGQVTWKHPFYDYFRQLREFCKQASREEVMQVRCNRLLWSYEATRVETQHNQEPLLCPEFIARMCDIFGYDIKKSGYLVRNLKAQLKVFAKNYREKQDIDIADVVTCAEILQRDVEKYYEMKEHWQYKVKEELSFDLNLLANGELQCVNCGTISLCFCLECKDYLCLSCYDALHNKGARLLHSPFRLVPCTLCVTMPAKLHCTFTDKSLCHQCYAMKHIKMLPPDGKENQPRRIDYIQQYSRYAQQAAERNVTKVPLLDMDAVEDDSQESVLNTDWHPFYDARGVKYYHNFSTGERMRQSPRRVPNTADPGAAPEPAAVTDGAITTIGTIPTGPPAGMAQSSPMPLSGFDSLETDPPARDNAALQKDLRSLRPPHRVHMPCEVPAY